MLTLVVIGHPRHLDRVPVDFKQAPSITRRQGTSSRFKHHPQQGHQPVRPIARAGYRSHRRLQAKAQPSVRGIAVIAPQIGGQRKWRDVAALGQRAGHGGGVGVAASRGRGGIEWHQGDGGRGDRSRMVIRRQFDRVDDGLEGVPPAAAAAPAQPPTSVGLGKSRSTVAAWRNPWLLDVRRQAEPRAAPEKRLPVASRHP